MVELKISQDITGSMDIDVPATRLRIITQQNMSVLCSECFLSYPLDT